MFNIWRVNVIGFTPEFQLIFLFQVTVPVQGVVRNTEEYENLPGVIQRPVRTSE